MKKQSTLFPDDEPIILTELSLSQAKAVAEQIKTTVAVHCETIEVVGSLRRQKPIVHDIDFVAIAKSDSEWQKISQALKHKKAKLLCSGNSVIKAVVLTEKGLFQVDFYRAQPKNWGIHLLVRTGSAEHNTWLASLAISKGMRIKYSEGLTKDGKVVAGETEQSVFQALNLSTPMPSQREILNEKPLWKPNSETKQ